MKLSLFVKIISGLFVLALIVIVFFHVQTSQQAQVTQQTFWDVTAIDTMKFSRDSAGDQDVLLKIPQYVSEIAALHPSYIAIDTPYDERFYPVLKSWVDEARRQHLKVWFRGNFSAWEGWFGYDKLTNFSEHHTMTKKFITSHPELFQDGDIFSPVPEAENGGMGDPRGSDSNAAIFNEFLQTSYANCNDAFRQIQKNVDCGYFSVNGDIAKQVLTLDTVARTGNRVVIDHYIDSPEQMAADLDYLHAKFPRARIVLGEFGAPIPDINGNMTDEEQAAFVKSLFDVFVSRRSFVEGMNYWTFLGSSTALFTDANTPKEVAQVVSNYFKPPVISGKVLDTSGSPIEGVTIRNSDNIVTQTDSQGIFAFVGVSGTPLQLTFEKNDYTSIIRKITIPNNDLVLQDIKLTPRKIDLLYKIKIFFQLF